MATVRSLNKWANAHSYYPLDFIRIGLGAFLFFKGITFFNDIHYLIQLAEPLNRWGGMMALIHYVAPAHLIGGVLIAFGLLTRWACLAEIPILIGAIAINLIGEFHTINFVLSTITLLVCIFFVFYGSGKHSADYFFKMRQ